MFRFLVKFFKILTIACLIGVSLRIVEVAFYKKDNIEEQEVAQVINDNIVVEDNEIIAITQEQDNVENIEKKDIKEAEQTATNVNKNEETNKKQETSSNKQKEVVEEKQEISKKENVQEIPKQEEIEIKEETQTEENYTEFEVEVAENKECEGNNHGIGVGNSNKWFNTKDEAIAEYRAEIKKWGDLWTDKENPISNEEYYKNCPYGYEIWNCMFCGKWTLNYYYD